MDLHDDDVIALVTDIWSAMTGIEITPLAALEVGGDSVTGFVHINGAWQGTVTLQCPAPLAATAAAAMFAMEVDDLTGEEIHDALGELTNMTGGGIKALLPGPSQLSIPTVVQGGQYRVSVPQTEQVAELHFGTVDAHITVRVLRRQVGATEAAVAAAPVTASAAR